MSFVNPLFAGSGDYEKMVERAQRAAKRAKVKHTSWQNYVRMLTRNPKAVLEFTTGTPRTDGHTVWLRVPIALGDDLAHDRSVCGERDMLTLIHKCPACRAFDGIDTTKYHEVGHIVSDSFMTMPDEEQVALVATAIKVEANGLPESKRAVKLRRRIELEKPRNFVHAADCISPWLKVLLNAVEDARVNAAMMSARPGTKVMFAAQSNEIFENGLDMPDGTVKHWRDAELNMQACIGVYCAISQLPFDRWLHTDVVEMLHDELMTDLCFRARTARNVQTCFNLSIRLLERMRELGFCLSEDDPEDDPEPGDGEDSDDTDGETEESDDESDGTGSGSGKSESSDEPTEGGGGGTSEDDAADDDTDGDDESDDDDEADGEGDGAGADDESSEDGADGGSDDDGSDDAEGDLDNPEWVDAGADEHQPKGTSPRPPMGDPEDAARGLQIFGRHDDDGKVDDGMTEQEAEEVERAIVQGDYFDAPSSNIHGVKVHTDGESGPAWTSGYYGRSTKAPIRIPETVLGPSLLQMRRVFSDNRRGGYAHDRKSGRIDGPRVARRLVSGDPRLFKKRVEPGKKDYFVLIGLDVSGSTHRPGVLKLIKEAGFAQAELLQRMGVKFAVYAHTGEDVAGNFDLAIYQVKSPDQPWDAKAKERLCGLQPSSANLDGHTLEYYRKVLDGQPATDKLLMYYTDGAMPAENYREELAILQREIEVCKQRGYTLVGVGVRNDDPNKHGLDTIRIDRVDDVPKVVNGLRTRIINR